MKHFFLICTGLVFAALLANAGTTTPSDGVKATAGGTATLQFHIPWPECYPCDIDTPPPMPPGPGVPPCWPVCISSNEIPSATASKGGCEVSMEVGAIVYDCFAVTELKFKRLSALLNFSKRE